MEVSSLEQARKEISRLEARLAKLNKPRKRGQRVSQEDLPAFKICTWDIEATGLQATFGEMLCAAIKPFGKETKVFRVDDTKSFKDARKSGESWDDHELTVAVRDELAKYDIAVSYNGFNYDIPFINTRLIGHNESILLSTIKHVDLIGVSRRRLRLHSNRLEALLGHLQAETRKTPLEPELWRRAAKGERKALDQIVVHNIADVVSLEEAFRKLIPFLEIQFRLIH